MREHEPVPSYGVTLGLAYLQRYGSHVRTAVLDSGSLLSVPLRQLSSLRYQQAFDRLVRQCAAAPACASSSCLLAAATTFIKAGQPGRPEPWNACTRAMPREPVPFPAP